MNYTLYQVWVSLTLLSAIAAVLIGVIILQQKLEAGDPIEATVKKAIAIAFFSIAIEIVARFVSLLAHTTSYPITELIICSLGRLAEAIGLWGLVLFLTRIWPFNTRNK